jgi:hypothetical protein
MARKSLLFIPDISGFTNFVQSTEVAHSQHVIAELLEVLLAANAEHLQLAEVEGDALFFYLENELLSQERLLAQVENMYTAFYSHLQLLEKNRICSCMACATAPNLQLKIVAHCGELQFITVQGNRKPFGPEVIEAHRLLKNSVKSDNYVLFSSALLEAIMMSADYRSRLFAFLPNTDTYDGKTIEYSYAEIDNTRLKLSPFQQAPKVTFSRPPVLVVKQTFTIPPKALLEYITNYSYRHYWMEGVDKFEYDEHEVTRLGTEHVCVINDKHLKFVAVTKETTPGKLVYGELTKDTPFADELYQFYGIQARGSGGAELEVQVFRKNRSLFKQLFFTFLGKRLVRTNLENSLGGLKVFVESTRITDQDNRVD